MVCCVDLSASVYVRHIGVMKKAEAEHAFMTVQFVSKNGG